MTKTRPKKTPTTQLIVYSGPAGLFNLVYLVNLIWRGAIIHHLHAGGLGCTMCQMVEDVFQQGSLIRYVEHLSALSPAAEHPY